MMRIWFFVFALLGLGIAAARAISPGEQIIILGTQSSASNVPLTPCTSTGVYDLSNVCNDIYFIGALK